MQNAVYYYLPAFFFVMYAIWKSIHRCNSYFPVPDLK